jgi:transposase-like protein
MMLQGLPCPHCHGTAIVRPGQTRPGTQRSRCRAQRGAGRTLLREESSPGPSPVVKAQIVAMALHASGMRATARVLPVRTNTVRTE